MASSQSATRHNTPLRSIKKMQVFTQPKQKKKKRKKRKLTEIAIGSTRSCHLRSNNKLFNLVNTTLSFYQLQSTQFNSEVIKLQAKAIKKENKVRLMTSI